MKVTKYSIKETPDSLRIIMPSPKDRKYKTTPIIAISILVLLGLLTERAYFNGYFGDTEFAMVIRIGFSAFIINLIVVFAHHLIYLYRGYESIHFSQTTKYMTYYKKGNWVFGYKSISFQKIVYWGVISVSNNYAFKEIGKKDRVYLRKKGGCLIFSQNINYWEDINIPKDTEFGAGLTPTEAQLIAQKIGNFLGK